MGNRGLPRLAEARAEWLADARFRRLSQRTIEEYERVSGHVVAFIATRCGHEATLTDLTAAQVREWINQRPLKPASVAAYVRAMRAFGRWCTREYGVDGLLSGLREPRVEPPAIAVFAPRQLRALLEEAPPYLAYAITCLAETGLRASEAIAVRTDEIDATWVVVRRGKGGRGRKVPVSRTLATATAIYLRQIRPALARADVSALLVNARGRSWTRDTLRTAVSRAGQRAGISGIRVSPHTFRHQFAHDVAFAGGSLIVLRDVLGHRSVSMVERYAVPDDAARQALVQRRTPLDQRR